MRSPAYATPPGGSSMVCRCCGPVGQDRCGAGRRGVVGLRKTGAGRASAARAVSVTEAMIRIRTSPPAAMWHAMAGVPCGGRATRDRARRSREAKTLTPAKA